MHIDPESLREQYGWHSDEALLQINRADLVADAQQIYDEELARRQLVPVQTAVEADSPESAEVDAELPLDEDNPAWLGDAATVVSETVIPGPARRTDAVVKARDVLLAARIPCHLELAEIPPYESRYPDPTHEWRVLVPGQLNLYAASVLERDIYNEQFEAEWKTHLEALSDRELRAMNPQTVFCGLYDRVERVKNVYAQELARRKLRG